MKNFLKNVKYLLDLIVFQKCYNLLTKDNDYINDIIEQHFNKEIEDNPDLSKFNKIYVIYVIKNI